MEFFEGPYLANLVFVVSIISLVLFVGKLSDKQHSGTDGFVPSRPEEDEMNRARKIQKRLVFVLAVLTIAGFFLGGYSKGADTQPMKMLHWLGILLIGACPVVILFLQEEKTIHALSRNRYLWLEFLLILIGGIVEVLFFITHNADQNTPLLSVRGITIFLMFVGLWLFLFFRLGRKVQD